MVYVDMWCSADKLTGKQARTAQDQSAQHGCSMTHWHKSVRGLSG